MDNCNFRHWLFSIRWHFAGLGGTSQLAQCKRTVLKAQFISTSAAWRVAYLAGLLPGARAGSQDLEAAQAPGFSASSDCLVPCLAFEPSRCLRDCAHGSRMPQLCGQSATAPARAMARRGAVALAGELRLATNLASLARRKCMTPSTPQTSDIGRTCQSGSIGPR